MGDLAALLARTYRVRCWERADRDPVELLCVCGWSEVRWPQRTNKRPDCPIHGQTDRVDVPSIDEQIEIVKGWGWTHDVPPADETAGQWAERIRAATTEILDADEVARIRENGPEHRASRQALELLADSHEALRATVTRLTAAAGDLLDEYDGDGHPLIEALRAAQDATTAPQPAPTPLWTGDLGDLCSIDGANPVGGEPGTEVAIYTTRPAPRQDQP